ncbi:class I SAM-dependent methyltransferase [Methylocella sp.]|uniref:class I SAM-dependent methyltransferase n=1 Tax=Methylocella sp. TaxID=1978226 RepID=UPI0035AE4542
MSAAQEAGEGKDEDFFARRAAARARLDALDPAKNGENGADALRKNWFEAVYEDAAGDAACVPWAHLAPHPLISSFAGLQLAGEREAFSGLRVLDVGCGLGDNAEFFASLGARVCAFDFVAGAVEWARGRFPQSAVDYRVADLFAPPPEWLGAFDLVNECYTLQALAPDLVPAALGALARVLRPGGAMLLVARARDEGEAAAGPPWPLPPGVFAQAEAAGLEPAAIEDVAPAGALATRHWRALLRRAPA